MTSDKGKVARQEQVGRVSGWRQTQLMFIHRGLNVFIHRAVKKMFTIGETRPNCEANEPQDAEGTDSTREIKQRNL